MSRVLFPWPLGATIPTRSPGPPRFGISRQKLPRSTKTCSKDDRFRGHRESPDPRGLERHRTALSKPPSSSVSCSLRLRADHRSARWWECPQCVTSLHAPSIAHPDLGTPTGCPSLRDERGGLKSHRGWVMLVTRAAALLIAHHQGRRRFLRRPYPIDFHRRTRPSCVHRVSIGVVKRPAHIQMQCCCRSGQLFGQVVLGGVSGP